MSETGQESTNPDKKKGAAVFVPPSLVFVRGRSKSAVRYAWPAVSWSG